MEKDEETSNDTADNHGSIKRTKILIGGVTVTMNDLSTAAEFFIDAIKNTESYRNYLTQKEKIEKFPELKNRIDEFRIRTFELQNLSTSDELFDKIDEFEVEYERFRENPVVDAFLSAEISFCRMMQEANWKITEALDFD